ncbi:uncharacterized protein N7503_008095 [Penicillium pulvis]|uniref:uncharacterized protein n=1 Tax=Penicillium pulvis TaxID=1562058 RepID=UPI0025493BFA|nr:uncharacterized protein N7503_008095 [Penicillium pulvis]KAJ5792117.1 hypothetical protein N7503_008095 [Penicillium pulvis]
MARQCPYCGMAYKNGHGLYIHLTNHAYFENNWRRPLDGIHDAREITSIVNRDVWEAERHQKPSSSGWRRYLVGLDRPGKGSDKPVFRFTNLPFGKLHFSSLCRKLAWLTNPSEIRLMIYEYLFGYEKITFEGSDVERVPKRRGIPLEFDSVSCSQTFREEITFTSRVHNPLAIMSTSSQIYAEARKVFYSQNKFYFPDLRTLHVFLLGIGDQNVQFLRTLECKASTPGPGTIRGQIRKCLPWIRMAGENPRPSIWYSEILDQILTRCRSDVFLERMFGPRMHRALMRVGSHKPRKEKDIIHHLFRMQVSFYRHNEQGQEVETNGKVSFKLCAFRAGR